MTATQTETTATLQTTTATTQSVSPIQWTTYVYANYGALLSQSPTVTWQYVAGAVR